LTGRFENWRSWRLDSSRSHLHQWAMEMDEEWLPTSNQMMQPRMWPREYVERMECSLTIWVKK
jgi:hypothetical protein